MSLHGSSLKLLPQVPLLVLNLSVLLDILLLLLF